MVRQNFEIGWIDGESDEEIRKNGFHTDYNYGFEELRRLKRNLGNREVLVEETIFDFKIYRGLKERYVGNFELKEMPFESCTLEGKLSSDHSSFNGRRVEISISNGYVIFPKILLTFDDDDTGDNSEIRVLRGYIEADITNKEDFDEVYGKVISMIEDSAKKDFVELRSAEKQEDFVRLTSAQEQKLVMSYN